MKLTHDDDERCLNLFIQMLQPRAGLLAELALSLLCELAGSADPPIMPPSASVGGLTVFAEWFNWVLAFWT